MICKDKIHLQTRAIFQKMFLLSAVILFSIGTGIAQEQSITLSNQSLSRREAISEIKIQTGFHFAINHASFNESEVVHFKKRIIPLHEALSQLLAGTNQTYIINGKQILIVSVDDEKKVPEEKPKNSPSPKKYNDTSVKNFINYNQDFEKDIKEFNSQIPTSEANRPIGSGSYKREVTPTKSNVHNKKSSYSLQQIEIVPTGKPVSNNLLYLKSVPSRFSIKTNLLYGLAALTPNLGVEIGLTSKTSLDLSVGWNPFNKEGTEESNKKLMHFLVKPEFRYWLCERSNGHFFGIHPFYVNYNISERKVPLLFEKKYRYEGDGYGIGVSYGYHWMLSKHWGLEFNAGVGVAFMNYSKFNCQKCSDKLGDFKKKYFGPTSLGIKLVYIIK